MISKYHDGRVVTGMKSLANEVPTVKAISHVGKLNLNMKILYFYISGEVQTYSAFTKIQKAPLLYRFAELPQAWKTAKTPIESTGGFIITSPQNNDWRCVKPTNIQY